MDKSTIHGHFPKIWKVTLKNAPYIKCIKCINENDDDDDDDDDDNRCINSW